MMKNHAVKGARREPAAPDIDREVRRMGSLSTLLNRAVAELVGLHPTDWGCLDLLDWTGPASAGTIASHLGLTSGAITGVVDRLEATGWVRRERDPDDRRRVIVVPVGDEDGVLAEAFGPLAARLHVLYEEMSGRDRRAVLRFLGEVNEVVSEAIAEIRTEATEATARR